MDENVVEFFKRRDKIKEALLTNNPKVLTDLGLDKITLTPSISNWLKANGLNLNQEEAENYANCLNNALHWYIEFKKLPNLTPAVIHHLVDTVIERDRATDPRSRKIKCVGGCSTCCYIKVSVTDDEAKMLALLVPEQTAWEKLKRQAEKKTVAEYSTLSDEDAACVFLDRDLGRCTIYEHRPSVCRLAYSLTGPSTCGRKPVGKNTAMIWFRAEAIVAAYVSLSQVGGMAEMILRNAQSQE